MRHPVVYPPQQGSSGSGSSNNDPPDDGAGSDIRDLAAGRNRRGQIEGKD